MGDLYPRGDMSWITRVLARLAIRVLIQVPIDASVHETWVNFRKVPRYVELGGPCRLNGRTRVARRI
jgi:hypothetical protein